MAKKEIIYKAQTRYAWIASLIAILISIPLFTDPPKSLLLMASALLFLLIMAFLPHYATKKSYLKITEESLSEFGGKLLYSYKWSEIASFQSYKLDGFLVIGFNLKNRPQESQFTKIFSYPTDHVINHHYPICTEELLYQLQSYQSKSYQ